MGFSDKLRALFKPSRVNIPARFEILKEAISGTMSKFYKARDRESGDVVGLKVCDLKKTEFFESRFTGLDKPFEGEIAEKFDHPLIVKTLEHGLTTDDERYLVMEFLPGLGLHILIKKQSAELEENAVVVVRNMARALQAVHEAGYIHRDVCPRNFICDHDLQSLKLIDFGLTVPATKAFMQPGNRTGTPNYMAPEIVRRRATDQRLDVFAFGVTAFQTCTFQLPWSGSDVSGKAALSHDTVPPLDIFELKPQIDQTLGQAITKCIAVQPDDRFSTFNDFLKAIESVEPNPA